MPYSIVWTATAATDYEDILDYLSRVLKSPQAARHLHATYLERKLEISENPYCCELVDDEVLALKEYRKAKVNNYLFVYVVDEPSRVITIIRFFHMTQSWVRYL